MNGKESIKLKSGAIKLKNYFKLLAIPFKIYPDFECYVLKGVRSNDKNNTSYTEKYRDHIPCSFAYKVACVDNRFSKRPVLYRGKMQFIDKLKQFLKSIIVVKKIIKKHFNKNLIMPAEEKERFQLSNSCWICDKLFDTGDDKVRDHCHITRKYRVSVHWSCNTSLKLSKKVPVVFRNLTYYDSHLIIKEMV